MMLYWTEKLRDVGIDIPELEEYENHRYSIDNSSTLGFADMVIHLLVKKLEEIAKEDE